MPPRRPAATAAAFKSTRSSRGRAAEVKDELGSDDEIVGVAPPKTTTKRTSSAKSSVKVRNRGRAASSRRRAVEQPSESDGSVAPVEGDASEDSEPLPPRLPGRKPTKRTSSVGGDHAQPSDVSDESTHLQGRRKRVAVESAEDNSEDVSGSKHTMEKNTSDPTHDAALEAPAAPLSEDEEDLLPQVSLRASAAPPSRVGRASMPHSRTARSSLGLPPTEIETGPKSRLVIYKMALVNFKSYKGRQEIGPFHKVSDELLPNVPIAHASLAISRFQP